MADMVQFKYISEAEEKTLNEIIHLYEQQGWWTKDDSVDSLKKLIKGSHCFLTAVKGNKVIAIARAISDGVCDAYIQDVAVLKTERSLGIGKLLVSVLTDKLKSDGIKWIGLIAQNKTSDFYKKNHFKVLENALPMLSEDSYV